MCLFSKSTNAIIRLDKWLGNSLSPRWSIVLCIIAIIFITFSQTAVTNILDAIDRPLSENPGLSMSATISDQENTTANTGDTTIDMASPWIVIFLIYAAFSEEFSFRLIPLVALFGASKRIFPNIKVPRRLFFIIISSFLFGILHGGLDHLLVQGITGVILCIVFLKCGGGSEISHSSGGLYYHKDDFLYVKSILRGLACATFTHFWINYIIVVIDVVFFGMRYVTLHG